MHLLNLIHKLVRRGNSLAGEGRFWGWARFLGENNRIELGRGTRMLGYVEVRGSGNRIIIGPDCAIGAKILIKGRDQTLRIGAGTSIKRGYLLLQEQCDISIGEECMFSRDVEIRTTDAHSLLDAVTGERLNKPGGVTIGNRVWIGTRSLVSKGTSIADDCVVGAMSFVSGSFAQSGVVIAGAPAKVVRKGIIWKRERLKLPRRDKSVPARRRRSEPVPED